MMLVDTLLRIGMAPLLILQALGVRKRAQSLPEAAGPRSGTMGNGPPLRLHIIGDSSAAGVGAETQQEALSGQLAAQLAGHFSVHWSLDALTGATTRSTLQRLQGGTPEKTDIVVVALGVNDITRLIPVSRWMALQMALTHRIRTLYQPQQIYLSGIPPMGDFPMLPNPLRWTLGRQAAAFDRAMRQRAEDLVDLHYLPFEMALTPDLMATDGFHPNTDGYALWAERVAKEILGNGRAELTAPR